MTRTLARTVVSTVVAFAAGVALVAVPAASAAAAPTPSGPSVVAMAQYRWDWSDGSNAVRRTFAKSEYGSAANLPTLIVTQTPTTPRHKVYLQYYGNGRWQNEATVYTDSNGEAEVSFNPICANGTWCDGTYKYRVTVAHLVQRFTITFTSE